MRASTAEPDWAQLSRFIAGVMGLHFPAERWSDLQRGIAAAAVEFGFENSAACTKWLLSSHLTREQLQVLASHLTIGETYFFRDKKTFETLTSAVLPALIQSRRGTERRLRFWSAACCSGEEAYSLAILLHQVLPDLKDWQIKILATDINPRFLRKAVAGSYGEWSFRNAPPNFKERYFIRSSENRYEVAPEIKAMVTFSHLNLAEDSYPSLATDTNAMDVIFCRNVLMYFTPAQIERAIANLHHCLLEGGWLAVSASETSQLLFSRFATRNFPGTILYQKSADKFPGSQTPFSTGKAVGTPPSPPAKIKSSTPKPVNPASRLKVRPAPLPVPAPLTVAEGLFGRGLYAEAAETLLTSVDPQAKDPRLFSLLARSLANQGKLSEALAWCDRWISADKVDPAGYYLRAIILLEQGDLIQAKTSLQRSVYLSPSFVLAHFSLGNLARGEGKSREAARHFTNARQLLAGLKAGDPLPESDGLTAGRLTETINALTTLEAAS